MALHIQLIAPTLQPTYVGLINTERDALLIVEACLSGKLNHIPRFPLHNEREEIVGSGNVYVYADVSTGEGVWDDGKEWVECGPLGTMIVQRCGSSGDGFFRVSSSYTVQGVAHGFVSYHQAKDVRWDSSHIGHSTRRSMTGQEGRSDNNGAK